MTLFYLGRVEMGDDGEKSEEADARLARLLKAVPELKKCGVSSVHLLAVLFCTGPHSGHSDKPRSNVRL